MHEYPVTQQIIRMAEKTALEHGASRVEGISLVIGDQSGYGGDSIQLYFDQIARGTLCEGARLTVRRLPAQVRCGQCGHEFERQPFSFACPLCGGQAHPTEAGTEFYIQSIEVYKDGE